MRHGAGHGAVTASDIEHRLRAWKFSGDGVDDQLAARYEPEVACLRGRQRIVQVLRVFTGAACQARCEQRNAVFEYRRRAARTAPPIQFDLIRSASRT